MLQHHSLLLQPNFNPRSPGGERRDVIAAAITEAIIFQSTLPGRGATFKHHRNDRPIEYFNPRSPGGERRRTPPHPYPGVAISIHAPRAGSDCFLGDLRQFYIRFQSTLPGRGATLPNLIKIAPTLNFNPRSPGGERQVIEAGKSEEAKISIHAPRAGSDTTRRPARLKAGISIHAPRAGSDYQYRVRTKRAQNISIHAPRAGSDSRKVMRWL